MKTHLIALAMAAFALPSCNAMQDALRTRRPATARTTSMRMGAGPNGTVGPVTIEAPAFDPRDISFGTAQENLFSH